MTEPFALGNVRYAEHELRLEQRILRVRRIIPPTIEGSIKASVIDLAYGEMVHELTAYVLGERLPSHTESAEHTLRIEYPATWWQHAKHQHAERWWMRHFVRRRPVVMTSKSQHAKLTATWEHMAAYPWSFTPIPAEKWGDPVMLRWLTSHMEHGEVIAGG